MARASAHRAPARSEPASGHRTGRGRRWRWWRACLGELEALALEVLDHRGPQHRLSAHRVLNARPARHPAAPPGRRAGLKTTAWQGGGGVVGLTFPMPVTSITRSPGCWPPPPARRVSPGTPGPAHFLPSALRASRIATTPRLLDWSRPVCTMSSFSDTLNMCFGHTYRRAVGRAAHPHSVRRQHVVHRDGRGERRHVVQVHLKPRTPRTNFLSPLEGYTSFINHRSFRGDTSLRVQSGHRARTPRPSKGRRIATQRSRSARRPPRAQGQRDGTTTSVPSRLRKVE